MPPKRKAGGASGAAAASKKPKGNIPVDKGLTEKHSDNFSVEADYGFLGNQVNIGDNNNKFYRGQVVTSSKGAFAWTRWGRVGENGQSKLEGPVALDAAVKIFEGKFKSKTGYKWDGAAADYPGGKAKKYTVIFEKHDGGGAQASALEAAAGGTPVKAVKYAPPTVTGPVAGFAEFITNADMFKSQLAEMGIDTTKMPLGDISQKTVDDGFKALLAVEAALKAKKPRAVVEQACGLFYTYIPHAFGRQRAPLLTLDDIQAKKDMLNVLGDVGSALSAQTAVKTRKGKKKASAKAKEELAPAPIDVKYASLKAELRHIKPNSAEFKMIQRYTDNTQGNRKCQVAEAFAVERDDEKYGEAEAGVGNRRLLWHGTNVAVVAAILQSGLRIMPHSGGRVGSGIYLASENGKSAGYVTAQGHDGVMFLCEAALGKQRIVTSDGQVGWNEKDPVSAHGCDSVLAMGRNEPKPSDDTVQKIGGREVAVPQGKVGANPALAKNGGSTSFQQSEYLVYKEEQCCIRYVLKMKFQSPGGHWH